MGKASLLPPKKYGTLQGVCKDQIGALTAAAQWCVFFSALMTTSWSTHKSNNVTTSSEGDIGDLSKRGEFLAVGDAFFCCEQRVMYLVPSQHYDHAGIKQSGHP